MIAYCCSANKARGETIIDSGKNHLQARAKHTTFATQNREVELCSENSGVRLFGFRYANSINSASYFHTTIFRSTRSSGATGKRNDSNSDTGATAFASTYPSFARFMGETAITPTSTVIFASTSASPSGWTNGGYGKSSISACTSASSTARC